MEDIERIRERKLRELQQKLEEQQHQRELELQYEIQKRQALRRILTPEARSRLYNLRMTKPEFVEQLEIQLIQLASAGRINPPITDVQLREILKRLQKRKREIRIRRI